LLRLEEEDSIAAAASIQEEPANGAPSGDKEPPKAE